MYWPPKSQVTRLASEVTMETTGQKKGKVSRPPKKTTPNGRQPPKTAGKFPTADENSLTFLIYHHSGATLLLDFITYRF